jgi:hypothetical protein
VDHRLVERLRQAGQEPESLALETGATLLVLPHGGRTLGLYAPGDARNFLWTNPLLGEEASAREFFRRPGWPNSGGDRTWLAPEIDLFFPDFPDLASYVQPPALDPGSYRAHRAGEEIRLAMELQVSPKSSVRPVRIRVAKAVRGSDNPLAEMESVRYAGFETHVELEALSPLSQSIGQWQLLQMPHGGDMIVATYEAADPLVVFGQPPDGHLRISDRSVRFRTNAEGDHKISIPAHVCTGRIGYFYEAEGISQLVVRNVFVNPSGAYVDASWADPSDAGYGVQVCSINGAAGRFSELEYHVPAMTPERSFSQDTSQVWAYRGPREALSRVAGQLLGVSL